jgi:hypothetical protein
MTENQFEDFLTKCLYENYPQLKDYQELTDKINQDEYKDLPELRIKFRPKFSWSESGKMVTGIGIRATNSLATIKKEDRNEILKKYGFDRQKDVKSSVPRLTLSLNRGEWADEYTDYDLYEQIYRYCEPTGIYNEEKREAIKALYMRAYFDNSPDNIAYHTWNAMNQEGASEQDVKDKMKKLREAIETVSGGKTYGSYIFFVESCVYVWALHYLTVFGKHKLWLLYDCFYSSPTAWGYEDEITFRLIVNNCIKESFEEFISYNS